MNDDTEIESMLRYLCTHENHFTFISSNVDVCIYSAVHRTAGDLLRLGKGPTLREAMASACKFVREQEQTHV